MFWFPWPRKYYTVQKPWNIRQLTYLWRFWISQDHKHTLLQLFCHQFQFRPAPYISDVSFSFLIIWGYPIKTGFMSSVHNLSPWVYVYQRFMAMIESCILFKHWYAVYTGITTSIMNFFTCILLTRPSFCNLTNSTEYRQSEGLQGYTLVDTIWQVKKNVMLYYLAKSI